MPAGYLINQARLRKVDELLTQVMDPGRGEPKTLTTFVGNLALHPLWGIPILLLVLLIIYEFVGVFGAQISVKFLERATTPLIVYLLGLPAKVTEAFIIGFLRRDYGAAGLFMMAKEGMLNPHQIFVSLVNITFFIPWPWGDRKCLYFSRSPPHLYSWKAYPKGRLLCKI